MKQITRTTIIGLGIGDMSGVNSRKMTIVTNDTSTSQNRENFTRDGGCRFSRDLTYVSLVTQLGAVLGEV